jgi:hypothetical protein
MSSGWIKLHRQLLDWEWYDDINTSRLFIHLMLTANHKDNKWRGIDIKRGSRLTSLDKLSSETNLSVSKIRTSIKKLISTSEIASKSHSQYTVFIMKNYDSYQGDDKPNDKPVTNESQTNDKQIATNKNDKNVNKDIYQQLADAYNSSFPDLPNVAKVSQKRKAHINAAIKEFKPSHGLDNLDNWVNLFAYIRESDFLMGRTSDWRCDFDFIINKNNLLKIIEGKYENANRA